MHHHRSAHRCVRAALALASVAVATTAEGQLTPRSTGTRVATRTAASTPPAPATAKYRVTINGFRVDAATRDHILDIDGVGDEVYLSSAVVVVDSARKLSTPLATLESRVYGELRRDLISGKLVWQGRNMSGTGTPRGGLRGGNTGPGREPWNQLTVPSTLFLPQELWCGTLVDGQKAVFITPTIWEWDGVSSTFDLWMNWTKRIPSLLADNELFKDLAGETGQAIVQGADLALGLVISLDSTGLVGGEADRPIGIRKSPQPKKYEFTPPYHIVLTYRSAEAFTRESFGGMRPGIYPLQYVDDGFYQGRYTVYVQVERMDGKPCAYEVPPPAPK